MNVLGNREIIPTFIVRIMQSFGINVCDPATEISKLMNPCRTELFSLAGIDTITINEVRHISYSVIILSLDW